MPGIIIFMFFSFRCFVVTKQKPPKDFGGREVRKIINMNDPAAFGEPYHRGFPAVLVGIGKYMAPNAPTYFRVG